MNHFEQEVYNFIQDEQLIRPGERLVIGVSGGADSVCLLRLLKILSDKLQIPEDGLAVVHVHHMIRGQEADRDAAFTKQLCKKMGIPYREYKKDICAYAKEQGMSVEEAGREYRYQCMEETIELLHFDKIAVAHNRDDVAETVLFHMIRGSGLKGLTGITAKRGNVIRPLLGVSREEIELYLAEIEQKFCQDSTNDSLTYARNKIRHMILPCMKEINAQAMEHICRIAEDAGKSDAFIRRQADAQFELAKQEASEDNIVLSVEKLRDADLVIREYLITEAIGQTAKKRKDITRKHIQSVLRLLNQGTGSLVHLPYGICVRRNYEELIFSQEKEQTERSFVPFCIPVENSGEYVIPHMGKLFVEVMPVEAVHEIPKKNYTKLLDYDRIKGNLCMRTPESGDYIVIDADENRKKLSRVFIDAKIDRIERQNWPVLACGQEVIWVVGLRFSPQYYINDQTKKVMHIDFVQKEN